MSLADSLLVPLTLTYKTLPRVSLDADVYLPTTSSSSSPLPILLYLHGGGWICGARSDLSVVYFHELLKRDFVVVTADYRLLPETDFLTGQLDDLCDLEIWLRDVLPGELKKSHNIDVDGDSIALLGASAGALLALLTVFIPSS